MVRHRNRNIDERNTIESPEIYSCTYGQFICDEGSKATQQRRDDLQKKGEPESESHGEQTGFAESDVKAHILGFPDPSFSLRTFCLELLHLPLFSLC